MAVEIRHMPQIDKPISGPQQVILRDVILSRKLIEQRRLRFLFAPAAS